MAKKKNASSSSAQAAVVDEKPATVANGTPAPMASPTKKAAPAAPSGPGRTPPTFFSRFSPPFHRFLDKIFQIFVQIFTFNPCLVPLFSLIVFYPSFFLTSSQQVTSSQSRYSDPVYCSFLGPRPLIEPIFWPNTFVRVLKIRVLAIFISDLLIFTDFYTKWTMNLTCETKLITWFSFFNA